jgi:ribosomal protein L22
LLEKKISLGGKYYTNAAKQILEVLESAEANAKQKDLAGEKLFIKIAKADAGETFIKPKSRWRLRGRKAKSSSITIEVEER